VAINISTEAHGLLTLRQFGEHDHAVDAVIRLGFDPARAFHFDAAGLRLR
jgi:multiple sugar transport system ATP-binding protein